jgi:hypothetical protein
MKRDIFRRGVRMQHQFGTLEQVNDPWGTQTWEEEWPKRVDRLSGFGRSMEISQHGERFYAPERSAVVKPAGGHASLNGPAPDVPELIARPIPVGTKRRSMSGAAQVKTDK